MRILILALAALLLTGCRVVFVPVPVPVDMPATLAAQPTPTPEPEPAEPAADSWAAFQAAYAVMSADFDALKAQLETARYADPDWRAETALLAQQWRRDIAALQAFDQPEGERWVEAWPLLQGALTAFDKAAAAVEDAAVNGDWTLAQPATGYMLEGARLLNQMGQ